MEVIFTAPWGERRIKEDKDAALADIPKLLGHTLPDDVVRVDVTTAAGARGDEEFLWSDIRLCALNRAREKLTIARPQDELEVVHLLLSVARRAEKRQAAADGGGEGEDE